MQTVAIGVVLALGVALALRGLTRHGRVEPEALLALRLLGGGGLAAMGLVGLLQGTPLAALVAALAAVPLLAPPATRRARAAVVATRPAGAPAHDSAPAGAERRAA